VVHVIGLTIGLNACPGNQEHTCEKIDKLMNQDHQWVYPEHAVIIANLSSGH